LDLSSQAYPLEAQLHLAGHDLLRIPDVEAIAITDHIDLGGAMQGVVGISPERGSRAISDKSAFFIGLSIFANGAWFTDFLTGTDPGNVGD
jgi:hypothetical protein